MIKDHPLKGIIAAPFTPMAGDGAVDFSRIREYAGRLKTAGVEGVFVGGTTGESLSLTFRERRELAESWAPCCDDDFPLVVHAGCESLADTVALSAHAKEIGAAAVGVMPPVFFKPKMEQLIEYCRLAAEACHPLPFYYYHIPAMTGVDLSMLTFARACGRVIPGFRGVKYSHGDMMEFSLLCGLEEKRYDVFFGKDEMLLSALPYAPRGMIGSTYNYAMPLYRAMVKCWEKGDVDGARRWQVLSQRLVSLLLQYGGGIVAGKVFSRIAGFDPGPCRLPNATVDEELIPDIRGKLKDAGVLEHMSL